MQAGLAQLCHKLELSDKSEQLISCLLLTAAAAGGDAGLVPFDDFKEGLVAFLAKSDDAAAGAGGEEEEKEGEGAEAPDAPGAAGGSSSPSPAPPTPPRSREMAPRLVYRNKKYGRKSRPSSVDTSDNEAEEERRRRGEGEGEALSTADSMKVSRRIAGAFLLSKLRNSCRNLQVDSAHTSTPHPVHVVTLAVPTVHAQCCMDP